MQFRLDLDQFALLVAIRFITIVASSRKERGFGMKSGTVAWHSSCISSHAELLSFSVHMFPSTYLGDLCASGNAHYLFAPSTFVFGIGTNG